MEEGGREEKKGKVILCEFSDVKFTTWVTYNIKCERHETLHSYKNINFGRGRWEGSDHTFPREGIQHHNKHVFHVLVRNPAIAHTPYLCRFDEIDRPAVPTLNIRNLFFLCWKISKGRKERGGWFTFKSYWSIVRFPALPMVCFIFSLLWTPIKYKIWILKTMWEERFLVFRYASVASITKRRRNHGYSRMLRMLRWCVCSNSACVGMLRMLRMCMLLRMDVAYVAYSVIGCMHDIEARMMRRLRRHVFWRRTHKERWCCLLSLQSNY